MMYVDGFLFAVPAANKDRFVKGADAIAQVLRDHGATRVVECWGDEVPEGKLTSMPKAVKLKPGEVVCFSWVEYPDRAARDACRCAAEADPRFAHEHDGGEAYDGRRMIYGGFVPVIER